MPFQKDSQRRLIKEQYLQQENINMLIAGTLGVSSSNDPASFCSIHLCKWCKHNTYSDKCENCGGPQ